MIRIQTEDFDPGAEIGRLNESSRDIGAVATFTGCVRADGGLIALTLEHYPAMTEREIARHVAMAEGKWPLLGTTIIHRVGRLVPGDRIVFVGVAASHRHAAFEACEFLMDYLKVHAPFWKQEERAGGALWVEAKSTDDDAARRWSE
jgi:molybdopterin synthase catalytic subunit